jgi:hypothetical protein
MARPKKEKLVATTGSHGQPLLVPASLAVPTLPAGKVEYKPAKKKVTVIAKKKVKDSDPHVLYIRSTIKIFKKIKEVADLNKVAFNDVANTILANFFLAPKEFYTMKKENL